MTRALRLVGLAAALTVPSLCVAQAKAADTPFSFGVSGGLSLPQGDAASGLNSGYSLVGHVFVRPAAQGALRFRGDLAYDNWDSKHRGIYAGLRSFGAVANALYEFSAAPDIRPYAVGGLGLYNTKPTSASEAGVSAASHTDIGVQVGGGVTFALSGLDTFVELKYVNVFSSGTNLGSVPITFGVRF